MLNATLTLAISPVEGLPFYIPSEHHLKLLVDLGKLSQLGVGLNLTLGSRPQNDPSELPVLLVLVILILFGRGF